MKIIYIAGSYSADNYSDVENNIRKAEKWSAHFWRQGYSVICPHKNTAHMEHLTDISYDNFLNGYLEILKQCDYIFLMKGWKNSKGAIKEQKLAKKLKIGIIYE